MRDEMATLLYDPLLHPLLFKPLGPPPPSPGTTASSRCSQDVEQVEKVSELDADASMELYPVSTMSPDGICTEGLCLWRISEEGRPCTFLPHALFVLPTSWLVRSLNIDLDLANGDASSSARGVRNDMLDPAGYEDLRNNLEIEVNKLKSIADHVIEAALTDGGNRRVHLAIVLLEVDLALLESQKSQWHRQQRSRRVEQNLPQLQLLFDRAVSYLLYGLGVTVLIHNSPKGERCADTPVEGRPELTSLGSLLKKYSAYVGNRYCSREHLENSNFMIGERKKIPLLNSSRQIDATNSAPLDSRVAELRTTWLKMLSTMPNLSSKQANALSLQYSNPSKLRARLESERGYLYNERSSKKQDSVTGDDFKMELSGIFFGAKKATNTSESSSSVPVLESSLASPPRNAAAARLTLNQSKSCADIAASLAAVMLNA